MLKRLKYYNDMYRKKKNLVLIHQMGKVGSTTVATSLKKHGWFPIHIHSFFSPLSYQMYKNYKTVKYYRSRLYRLKYIIQHRLILELLKKRRKLKIISMVREPVSRNISMYFHAFHIPLMSINKYYDNRREENTNLAAFRRDFFHHFNHQYGIQWFEHEFQKAWGINVYDYPFNQEKGYSTFQQGNVEVLLLKMEKLDELENVIQDFLDVEDFELHKDNFGENKWYQSVYREFKEGVYPDKSYIEELYHSKYMNHFYSSAEQEKYIRKYEQ